MIFVKSKFFMNFIDFGLKLLYSFVNFFLFVVFFGIEDEPLSEFGDLPVIFFNFIFEL